MENDFIEIHDDVLTSAQCEAVIALFDSSPHVQRGQAGGGVDLNKKNSYDLTLDRHAEYEPVLRMLMALALPGLKSYLRKHVYLIVGAISLDMRHRGTGRTVTLSRENFAEFGEPNFDGLVGKLYRFGEFTIQKYAEGIGGYPHWHSEIYPRDETCETLHRVLAFQFYLNDVPNGGETEFFYQKRKVGSRAGRMVVFPAGFTHTHRGNRPESNDKYVVTSWVLFHRADRLYGA